MHHTLTHACTHPPYTHTDGNNTDTWLALKSCCVCIPLPLSIHPPHSHKAGSKTRKTKTQKKRLKGGNGRLPSFFHPSLLFTLLLFLCTKCLPSPCEKRGMWTDRVRKERNLAEGKRAKAFKVCHRAVTKAS